jgi:hypothetical protein
MVGERESAALLRDRLLPRLAERGTSKAAALLRDLAEQENEPWLHRLAARADVERLREDWTPHDVDVVVSVLADAVALEREKPSQPRLWSSVFAGVAAVLAILVVGIGGFPKTLGAGKLFGCWLLTLALGVSGVLVRREAVRRALVSKSAERLDATAGGALLLATVAILLVPIVVTVLLRQ